MNKLFVIIVITVITVIVAVCIIFIIKKIFYVNYCECLVSDASVKKKDSVYNKYSTSMVNEIHDNLFKNYEATTEKPERIGILRNLKKNDRVLEIGANRGGVTEVIAQIVEPKNFVTIEPSRKACIYLEKLSNKLGKKFNIFNGVLNNGLESGGLECSDGDDDHMYADCKLSDFPKNTDNITFEKLQKKYNINFNVLVIDCEGCYKKILEDMHNKQTFKNIDKIVIEWDGKFMEDILLQNGFLLVDYIPHSNLKRGVRTYFKQHLLEA
jgi:FkbM family methyltransferase